jgi:hypothetical protein
LIHFTLAESDNESRFQQRRRAHAQSGENDEFNNFANTTIIDGVFRDSAGCVAALLQVFAMLIFHTWRVDLNERANIYADISRLIGVKDNANTRKAEWIQEPEPLIRAMLTDCKRDNEKLMREAMTVLGRVMSVRKSLRHVNARLLEAVIEMFRVRIERSTQKNRVYMAAWALSGQALGAAAPDCGMTPSRAVNCAFHGIVEIPENLVRTIGDYLRAPRFPAANIIDGLVVALAKCIQCNSARMRSLMALWAMPLVTMMFKCDGESRDLQDRAERVLRTVINDMFRSPAAPPRRANGASEQTAGAGGGGASLLLLPQTAPAQPHQIVRPSSEFTTLLATATKERLSSELSKLLAEPGRERIALRVWSVLVVLLGDKLFTDKEVKNALLSLAETAFSDPINKTTRELTFVAWLSMVDACALQQPAPFDEAVTKAREGRRQRDVSALVQPWTLLRDNDGGDALWRWRLQNAEQSRWCVAAYETLVHLVHRVGAARLPLLYAQIVAPTIVVAGVRAVEHGLLRELPLRLLLRLLRAPSQSVLAERHDMPPPPPPPPPPLVRTKIDDKPAAASEVPFVERLAAVEAFRNMTVDDLLPLLPHLLAALTSCVEFVLFDIDAAGANAARFAVTQPATAVTPTTSITRAPTTDADDAHALLRAHCETHSLRALDDCCRLAAAVYAAPAPINRSTPPLPYVPAPLATVSALLVAESDTESELDSLRDGQWLATRVVRLWRLIVRAVASVLPRYAPPVAAHVALVRALLDYVLAPQLDVALPAQLAARTGTQPDKRHAATITGAMLSTSAASVAARERAQPALRCAMMRVLAAELACEWIDVLTHASYAIEGESVAAYLLRGWLALPGAAPCRVLRHLARRAASDPARGADVRPAQRALTLLRAAPVPSVLARAWSDVASTVAHALRVTECALAPDADGSAAFESMLACLCEPLRRVFRGVGSDDDVDVGDFDDDDTTIDDAQLAGGNTRSLLCTEWRAAWRLLFTAVHGVARRSALETRLVDAMAAALLVSGVCMCAMRACDARSRATGSAGVAARVGALAIAAGVVASASRAAGRRALRGTRAD